MVAPNCVCVRANIKQINSYTWPMQTVTATVGPTVIQEAEEKEKPKTTQMVTGYVLYNVNRAALVRQHPITYS